MGCVMIIDKNGQVSCHENEIFTAIYSGKITNISFVNCSSKEVAELFNNSADINFDTSARISTYEESDLDQKTFDQRRQQELFMPDEYKNLDICNWLLDQCKSQIETQRVLQELQLFIELDILIVLQYLKYVVDVMRNNNIVWGVGRGSSVASYCLYLIGAHKIDSIKYGLDIKEFLK
jgi:DNA polymerase III alpha subunit